MEAIGKVLHVYSIYNVCYTEGVYIICASSPFTFTHIKRVVGQTSICPPLLYLYLDKEGGGKLVLHRDVISLGGPENSIHLSVLYIQPWRVFEWITVWCSIKAGHCALCVGGSVSRAVVSSMRVWSTESLWPLLWGYVQEGMVRSL